MSSSPRIVNSSVLVSFDMIPPSQRATAAAPSCGGKRRDGQPERDRDEHRVRIAERRETEPGAYGARHEHHEQRAEEEARHRSEHREVSVHCVPLLFRGPDSSRPGPAVDGDVTGLDAGEEASEKQRAILALAAPACKPKAKGPARLEE